MQERIRKGKPLTSVVRGYARAHTKTRLTRQSFFPYIFGKRMRTLEKTGPRMYIIG